MNHKTNLSLFGREIGYEYLYWHRAAYWTVAYNGRPIAEGDDMRELEYEAIAHYRAMRAAH